MRLGRAPSLAMVATLALAATSCVREGARHKAAGNI
jgi:hypothetical protein